MQSFRRNFIAALSFSPLFSNYKIPIKYQYGTITAIINIKCNPIRMELYLMKSFMLSNAEKKALVLTVLVVAYLIGSSFLGWKTAYGFRLLPPQALTVS